MAVMNGTGHGSAADCLPGNVGRRAHALAPANNYLHVQTLHATSLLPCCTPPLPGMWRRNDLWRSAAHVALQMAARMS